MRGVRPQRAHLCAANRAQGLPAISVNFGPFGEVGMAAAYAGSMREIGLHPLPLAACHAAFQSAGYAQRAVQARIAVSQFSKVNTAMGPWAFLDQLAHVPIGAPSHHPVSTGQLPVHAPDSSSAAAAARAAAAAAAAMPLQGVVQLVCAAASEVLGEDIGPEGHFAAHQFDSLAAVELSSSLGRAAGCELPATLVFDYPSVEAAAIYVHGLMQPQQATRPLRPDAAITPQSLGPLHVQQRQNSSLIRIGIAARLPEGAGLAALGLDIITTAPSSRQGPLHCFDTYSILHCFGMQPSLMLVGRSRS